MLGAIVVRGTILIATVLWAWAEVLKIRRFDQVEPARRLWTIGLVLTLVHAIIAFDVAYGWSHEAAVIDTARQTAEVTGLAWGGGLFVNHFFLALWLADAVWWWVAPIGYLRRPLALERSRLAFFLVMFFNGAIVFAGMIGRAVGVPAIAAVCTAWALDARRRPVHA
jgi:hypothetical protein